MPWSAGNLIESTRQRWQIRAAVVWGLAVAVVMVGVALFLRAPALDTDVLALLPDGHHDVRVAQAVGSALGESTADVLVLLRSSDTNAAREAAATVREVLRERDVALREVDRTVPDPALLEAFQPWRRGLLADAQRDLLLARPPGAWAEMALVQLYSPMASGTGVLDDPLGLGAAWWQSRARGVSHADGEWVLALDGDDAVLLRFQNAGGAFRVDGSMPLADALDVAGSRIASGQGSHVELLAAGVPLIAEAAAAQAAGEMTTIGLGSLLAVIVIVAFSFRGLLPVLLVATSLLVGVGAGLVATWWVFGQVHVLTLVFGAALVGVAEDYGIHYFAARQGDPRRAGIPQLDRLLPGLLLAFVTSALAYAALGLAPFPGLRQMALFSSVGLLAAFLTVACWFPLWPKQAPKPSWLSERLSRSLAVWPRLSPGPAGRHLPGTRSGWLAIGLVVLAVVTAVAGLARLRVDDQLRSLQGVPAGVLERQQQVAALLDAPSPAQFFVVEADDEETLLQREEALIGALHPLREEAVLSDWQAVSEAVPSERRQRQDRELVTALESSVRAHLAEALGEPLPPPAPDAATPLDIATWLASPLSLVERPLWLGEHEGRVASVVRLSGIHPGSLQALSALAGDGVRWVDRTADYSQLLKTYRVQIQGWLGLGVLAIAFALLLRFGRQAWRALVPTLLAGALALGVQGLIGEPLQLFNVLALMLLLGVGIDYGIFLLEHKDDGASWLAVSLGAASTLLGFGLLALSETPALHGFGLTMLVGVGAVWGLSPLFRPWPREAPSGEDSEASAG